MTNQMVKGNKVKKSNEVAALKSININKRATSKKNKRIDMKRNHIDLETDLLWDDTSDEYEALFNLMVDIAYEEDTPKNEETREQIWHNETMRKYFDAVKFKNDLIDQGWIIIESSKGFAFKKLK